MESFIPYERQYFQADTPAPGYALLEGVSSFALKQLYSGNFKLFNKIRRDLARFYAYADPNKRLDDSEIYTDHSAFWTPMMQRRIKQLFFKYCINR